MIFKFISKLFYIILFFICLLDTKYQAFAFSEQDCKEKAFYINDIKSEAGILF